MNEVYKFMVEYQRRVGRPPTMEEIAEGTAHRYRSGVQYQLRQLEQQGLVSVIKGENKARRYYAEGERRQAKDI
jgi:SOS-response transcriptional repressor LexA